MVGVDWHEHVGGGHAPMVGNVGLRDNVDDDDDDDDAHLHFLPVARARPGDALFSGVRKNCDMAEDYSKTESNTSSFQADARGKKFLSLMFWQ